jgi:hypothetical protein
VPDQHSQPTSPPGTDPRLGYIQQQLTAQDRLMAQMAEGIKEIQKTVTDSVVGVALSVQDRTAIRKDLDEIKANFRAYMGHKHPDLDDIKAKHEKLSTKVDDHDSRINRDETVGRVAIAIATIVMVPILLMVVGGFGTLFWLVLTHKFIVP